MYSAIVKWALLKYTKVMARRYWKIRGKSQSLFSVIIIKLRQGFYFTLSVILQQQSIHRKSRIRSSTVTKHNCLICKCFFSLFTDLKLTFTTWMQMNHNMLFYLGYSFTKKSEIRCHFLSLNDNSWGHGHFGIMHVIPRLARLALFWRALWILAVGSFQPETSSDLEGVRTVGFDPHSYWGGSLAPTECLFHHASVWIMCGEEVSGLLWEEMEAGREKEMSL